jgi:hypothetical protein
MLLDSTSYLAFVIVVSIFILHDVSVFINLRNELDVKYGGKVVFVKLELLL